LNDKGGLPLKKKSIIIILAAAIFLMTLLPIQAQEIKKQAASIKISVKILGDKNVRNLVKSFIGRELRALKGVEITDNDPDWVLRLVTVEVKLKDGVQTGFGISGVVLKPFKSDVLTPLLDKRFINRGHTLTADLHSIRKHMVNIGPTEDIQKICKKIVADLDNEYLEIKTKNNEDKGQ
jgi:hypothetical protein